MTVSRISAACWIFFVVMCVAFIPLGIAIMAIHAIPATVRVVLAAVVVVGVWWGPFADAMYLAMAVMRNGDRRLLRRGIAATAQVLSAKATNTVIQDGSVVNVAVRPLNRKRVTIDVGQGGRRGSAQSSGSQLAGMRYE